MKKEKYPFIVDLTLNDVAAKATPWAWFPAEEAITPLFFSSSVKLTNLLYAPLNLKAPVFCLFSHFKYTLYLLLGQFYLF